jgi:hypothetical protein
MSLNDYSSIANLRIPAVPVVFSQTLSKPHTKFCSQCGLVLPQNFPWTACDDCQLNITRLIADVPAPGQTLRVNQDVASLRQYVSFMCRRVAYMRCLICCTGLLNILTILWMQRGILSTCISCLMAFEVSRSNSTLYRDSVCNACQIQQEGTKLKSTRRNTLIATTSHPPPPPPPPLPPPYTFPDIRDPPYPSFFNSRGELVASPLVTAPVSINEHFPCMNFSHGWR